MKYSIEMELMALLILAIIILFHMGMPNDSTGRRMFTISLGLSELTIVFNIITVLVMQNASAPLVLNYAMNTLYFALQYVSFSVLVIYAVYM